MKFCAALSVALMLSSSTVAFAQDTIRGAQDGVVDGTRAAGPVGGVVGGAVGAAAGTVGGVLGVGEAPRAEGCSTQSVTQTDGQTGDTVKKTASNC